MSELGRLVPSSSGNLTYLSGHIQTIAGKLVIALEGDERLCGQQQPSHRVKMRASDGSMANVGAAWLKTCRHGPQKGKLFFTIQIDYPERPAPLNVAAFSDEKTGEWSIVWRRRGAQPTTAVATAA